MTTSIQTLYTCGHSNRDLAEFFHLLACQGIERLVDIRRYPVSRRNPQYSRDSLQGRLATAGIFYQWSGDALGGRRIARVDSPHIGLEDSSLRGFAEHMEGKPFMRAMQDIIQRAGQYRVVLMCAERLPECCHRNLVADYLLWQGCRVIHLIAAGVVREHRLHPLAREHNGRLVYNRETTVPLDLR